MKERKDLTDEQKCTGTTPSSSLSDPVLRLRGGKGSGDESSSDEQRKQKIPRYSFVGDEAINIEDNIPVLGEKSKESSKGETQKSTNYEKPGNEEMDPTDDNSKSSYTPEGNLNGKCRGCGEHKDRLLRHLSSKETCMNKYTAEELEKHKQAVKKKYRINNKEMIKEYKAKNYQEKGTKIKASAVKHYQENKEEIKASKSKHYQENKEEIKESRSKQYQENKEEIKASRRKH